MMKDKIRRNFQLEKSKFRCQKSEFRYWSKEYWSSGSGPGMVYFFGISSLDGMGSVSVS